MAAIPERTAPNNILRLVLGNECGPCWTSWWGLEPRPSREHPDAQAIPNTHSYELVAKVPTLPMELLACGNRVPDIDGNRVADARCLHRRPSLRIGE